MEFWFWGVMVDISTRRLLRFFQFLRMIKISVVLYCSNAYIDKSETQIIIKIAAGNGVGRILVGQ